MDSSAGRGVAGGHGYGEWRRRAPLGCAREREQRARERAESEGEERGASGRRRGIARRGRGSRRWRGRVLGGGALSPSSACWQRWVVTGMGQVGRPSPGKRQVILLSLSFL